MHRQRRLLLARLHGHEPHRRPRDRLANRRRIGGVGLAALHIRLDVSRRHQSHLVPEAEQLARPMMGRAARLDPDQAWRQFGEERQNLRTPQRRADDDLAGRINAVNLKDALRQIQADGSNLHGGWLLCSGLPDSHPAWHSDAASGSHPPHLLPRSDQHCLSAGDGRRSAL